MTNASAGRIHEEKVKSMVLPWGFAVWPLTCLRWSCPVHPPAGCSWAEKVKMVFKGPAVRLQIETEWIPLASDTVAKNETCFLYHKRLFSGNYTWMKTGIWILYWFSVIWVWISELPESYTLDNFCIISNWKVTDIVPLQIVSYFVPLTRWIPSPVWEERTDI